MIACYKNLLFQRLYLNADFEYIRLIKSFLCMKLFEKVKY